MAAESVFIGYLGPIQFIAGAGGLILPSPVTISSGPLTLTSGQYLAAPHATIPGYSFIGADTTGIGRLVASDTLVGFAGSIPVWQALGVNSGQFLVGESVTESVFSSQDIFYTGRSAANALTAWRGAATTSSGIASGLNISASYSGGTQGVAAVGVAVMAQTLAASTGNFSNASGGLRNVFTVNHFGSGLVTLAGALIGGISASGTNSPITTADIFRANTPTVTAASVITSFRGFHVVGGAITGAITTRDGFLVDDLVGGTTRYAFRSLGASDLIDFAGPITFRSTLAPASQQTYAITNVTTDRAYDANATSLDELADTLGTLIADLRTIGLVL